MNFNIPFMVFPSSLEGWLLFAGLGLVGVILFGVGFGLFGTKRHNLGLVALLVGAVSLAGCALQSLLPTQAAGGRALAEQAETVYGVELDMTSAHQLRREVSHAALEEGKGEERWESDPVEVQLDNTTTFLKLVWDKQEWVLVSYEAGEPTELDRI